MDIIDIMLARAMTPQGQTDIYVNKANKAAATAEQAKSDATAAVATVEAAATTIEETQAAADDLLATAQEALETAQQAQINTLDTEDVDIEIKKMTVNSNVINGQNANTIQIISTYPDNTLNTQNITKLYKQSGQNEDGTMTQKAITNTLDTTVTNITNYVNNAVSNVATSINMGSENAGHLVAVGNDGGLTPSSLTEGDLINGVTPATPIIPSGDNEVVGLDINYTTSTYTRTYDAIGKTFGTSFDTYTMYGGRVRCNVSDNGEITAFYGESNYRDDGSNGQVMIYQPKFYYKRTPQSLTGFVINQENLILSTIERSNFKLAPIFYDGLDYVLLSAYGGSLANDKLNSVSGQKLVNNISITEAEAAAAAHGNGWHIMNMAAVSANQMLQIVEFGNINGQTVFESGIIYKPNNENNVSFLTGSTASLGNVSGHAATTTVINSQNVTSTQTEDGCRAISYRGFEDPWGNLWNLIGGTNIVGNGLSGGTPYICDDFDYSFTRDSANYHSVGFNLPNGHNWVKAFGYSSEEYDWVFLPVQCSSDANSLIPIGDNFWAQTNLNGINIIAHGGAYGFQEECGPFYYAADQTTTLKSSIFSARLMYIPTKNSIYNANIAKWQTYMGGNK